MAAAPADPFSSLALGFGQSVGKGVGDAISGGGGPHTMVSGAPVDARSFMDGSGWVVSTGQGRAYGGSSGGASFGQGQTAGQPNAIMAQQAGIPGGLIMALVVAGGLWLAIRK